MTGNPNVDRCIDVLCGHGCRAVREYIDALRAGSESTHWAELDAVERGLLCQELENIMAVYGDKCEI
ncbi:MAG: hypothetical protein HY941_08475 [Gammaproteobacteria bacterium]|nr:hypothetical protein [Gammaproteobacteria bacterium]